MIRTLLVNMVRSNAPRVVALVVGPVMVIAAPFLVKAGNGWLNAGLTTQQVTEFALATMGAVTVKAVTYLITHFKLNAKALDKIPLVNDITPLNSVEAKVGKVNVVGTNELKAQFDELKAQVNKLGAPTRKPRSRKAASAAE